ncbi:MAG: carboxypeptidase-like regulatory domain-containing protein, partial [Bacteroidales bacterium]|nr:carboxypeptidase-like regulatory domain-containing protein [Bacteroidales bacterium]
MKKLILLLCISFVFHVFIKASETQTIRGTIVDKDSKMTIIGATVVLLNSDPLVGTVTDLDGEFRLEKIPLGRQGVKISYVGYNDVFVNSLLLSAGKEIVLEIEMEEKVLDIDEVVIKAYDRKDETINEMAMISARSFTIEETERYAGSLGDPARMVANYAGVMTQNDSRNDII